MCLEVPSAARNNTNKSSLRNVETILSAYRQHQFNSNSSVHTLPGHGQGSCPISIFLLVDPATQACTYFYNVVMLSSPAIRQFRETRHTILRHMKPCSLRIFEFRGCCVDEKDRLELYGKSSSASQAASSAKPRVVGGQPKPSQKYRIPAR